MTRFITTLTTVVVITAALAPAYYTYAALA